MRPSRRTAGHPPDARSVVRSIARSRTASRRCPASCASGGLLRRERAEQVGLARLGCATGAGSARRSPAPTRLAPTPSASPRPRTSAPSEASACCTLSSITVRSMRSANESAPNRYAADAPGPSVMNACRARSFNRAWTASDLRLRARQRMLRVHQPSLQTVEHATGGRHVRRSDEDPALELRGRRAGARRPVGPARSARRRAVSIGGRAAAADVATANVANVSTAAATRRPDRCGAERFVLPPRSSIGRPRVSLDARAGALGYPGHDGSRSARLPGCRPPALRRGAAGARPGARVGGATTSFPASRTGSRPATFPKEMATRARPARPAGHAPRGLRMPGGERRLLRTRVPGARGGRLRVPLVRERAGVALHVPDLEVRHRGAEGALAARRWRPAR